MKVYYGDLFFCIDQLNYKEMEDSYIIVNDTGQIVEVCSVLPEKYQEYEIISYKHQLIIPAFSDLHLHAAQYQNTGLGYDLSFPDWLTYYTYPSESAYADLAHANAMNQRLITDLWKNGIMHSSIFGSTSMKATQNLMKLFDRSGMTAYIGKMNSDTGAYGPAAETTEESIAGTYALIQYADSLSSRITYCVSPEFTPCCSEELLTELGRLVTKYQLPFQTHHAEGYQDVALTKKRYPEDSYAKTYERHGLLNSKKAVFAHSICLTEQEYDLINEYNVITAHCPVAISNIPSDITMPLRARMNQHLRFGLGSDIGGGHTLNMMRIIVTAVQYSKFQSFIDHTKPLSILEAFYLATLSSSSYFGDTGSFLPGYMFDALVINDEELSPVSQSYSIKERIERFLYSADSSLISTRYCGGNLISKPCF